MPEPAKVPSQYAVVKKGDNGLQKLLSEIKSRSQTQVLILGQGVGVYYSNRETFSSALGERWDFSFPPNAPTWEQNQQGILGFSKKIQEDAAAPRIGIFISPPDFIERNLFLPSKSGPYSAAIYVLGLSQSPISDMEHYRKILLRPHIQSPWVECIFSSDNNKLRIKEQEEIEKALDEHTGLGEILPRILRNLEAEFAGLAARDFEEKTKKIKKEWWQF